MALAVPMCGFRNENLVNQNLFRDLMLTQFNRYTTVSQTYGDNIVCRFGPNVFEFVRVGFLGEGGNGAVYHYRDNRNRINIAVKCCRNGDEINISEHLILNNCRTLFSKYVGQSLIINGTLVRYPFIMELAEGNIRNYLRDLRRSVVPNLTDDQLNTRVLSLVEEVRQQMVCIYNSNNNYVYTDLKVDNILFKCDNPARLNDTRIFLGDLGSAVGLASRYIATYPPYEHRNGDGILILNTEREKLDAMAWELGVLLLSIYHGGTPEFADLGYHRIRGIDVGTTFATLYQLMEQSYGPDLARLIQIDPINRRSILDPIPIQP